MAEAEHGGGLQPDDVKTSIRRGVDTIEHLARLGATFTLNSKQGKRPFTLEWQRRGVTKATATTHLLKPSGGNVGLLTGAPSAKLVILDLDRDFPDFAKRYPERLGLTVIRSNAPDRGKVIVRLTDEVPRGRKFRLIDATSGEPEKPYLELLARGADHGTGNNAIVAGSHNGGTYELRGDTPAEMTSAELTELVDAWRHWQDDDPENDKHPHQPPIPATSKPAGNEIREAIVAELIANHCGKWEANQLRFCCLVHNDRRPSAFYSPNLHGGVWKCFSCDAGGGWLKLAKLLGIQPATPAHDARTLARRWRHLLCSMPRPFPGRRNAATLRKVSLAIIAEVERTGQQAIAEGVRRVANLSGVTKATAGRALNSLVELGVLSQKEPHKGTKATVIELQRQAMTADETLLDLAGANTRSRSVSVTDLEHDAFRYRTGLGGGAWFVWLALRQHALTFRQLVTDVHPVRSSVGKWLGRMAELGLVTRTDTGAWTATALSLDKVDVRAVHEKRGVTQRTKYGIEQAGWRAKVAEDEARRSVIESFPDTVIDFSTGEVLQEAPDLNDAPAPSWDDTQAADEPDLMAAQWRRHHRQTRERPRAAARERLAAARDLRRDWKERAPCLRALTTTPGDPVINRLVSWLVVMQAVTPQKLAA